jgi:hypothetical protein
MALAPDWVHCAVSANRKSRPVQRKLNDVDRSVGSCACGAAMIARDTEMSKLRLPRPRSVRRTCRDGRVRESVLNWTEFALAPRTGEKIVPKKVGVAEFAARTNSEGESMPSS